ncbi:TraR/DksA family transcriptional regulator [Nitrosomonas sp. ANs5]|uniref:TraR/DksA family transcriptional regulator n=1 Tax=Nitrosomonas sp. ANs5 TaxID=3423941 RepID=UPI003D32FC65
MHKQTLENFKTRLEQMREALHAGEDTSREAAKPVILDQASVGRLSRMDAMQGQAMAIETQRRRKILAGRIERALARMAAGDYGICQSCEEAIDPRRLEIDPTASLCIACASEHETR